MLLTYLWHFLVLNLLTYMLPRNLVLLGSHLLHRSLDLSQAHPAAGHQ